MEEIGGEENVHKTVLQIMFSKFSYGHAKNVFQQKQFQNFGTEILKTFFDVFFFFQKFRTEILKTYFDGCVFKISVRKF